MPYTVKRFRFRLQTLLNIEQNKEKQAQIAFQKAITELRRQRQVLADQEYEYQREQRAMAQAIRRGTSPQELSAYDLFFTGLKARMEEQKQRIAQADQAVEEARKELAERTKQRKIMEKLREKAQAAHDEEARRVETAMFDEVGTSLSFRKEE
jgi:flagellar FliJ protein